MTIRRVDETVLLEGVCAVEEAETLMQEIQGGAAVIDWSDCTHLHTACFQVILAAGLPTRGMPANALLRRWLPGLILAPEHAVGRDLHALETACLTEA